jgi:hypothetical protein
LARWRFGPIVDEQAPAWSRQYEPNRVEHNEAQSQHDQQRSEAELHYLGMSVNALSKYQPANQTKAVPKRKRTAITAPMTNPQLITLSTIGPTRRSSCASRCLSSCSLSFIPLIVAGGEGRFSASDVDPTSPDGRQFWNGRQGDQATWRGRSGDCARRRVGATADTLRAVNRTDIRDDCQWLGQPNLGTNGSCRLPPIGMDRASCAELRPGSHPIHSVVAATAAS